MLVFLRLPFYELPLNSLFPPALLLSQFSKLSDAPFLDILYFYFTAFPYFLARCQEYHSL